MTNYLKTGPVPESRAFSEARTDFEIILSVVNRYAAALRAEGVEPMLEGWTAPMERDRIRMDGKTVAYYQSRGKQIKPPVKPYETGLVAFAGPAPGSPDIDDMIAMYENAVEHLDKAALRLNALNVEPVLEGWGPPLKRWCIRLQGNSGHSYQAAKH